MNTPRSIPLRLCYVLLAISVGCATGGSHNQVSQSSSFTPDQTVTHHDAISKIDDGEPVAEVLTLRQTTNPPTPELISAGFTDRHDPSETSGDLATLGLQVADDIAGPELGLDTAEFTLESLEQLAIDNNPAIRQASASAQKAMGIRAQVGLLPNPTVGYFGSQLGDAGTDQNGAFLNQDIVLGDKLALNRQVIDQDVQTLLWEVEAQRFRVRTDIRRHFYDALAAQRRLTLSNNFQEVALKGVRVAEERMRALEGAQPDVLQSEIQLNEVDLITQQAQIDFTAAWRELAATAGLPNMAAPTLVGTLEGVTTSREMESAYAELLGRSPELQAAYTRVQRARANLARQHAQPIPNLQAQLQFGHDRATGSQLGNVQLGLPLPIFNNNEGNIYAAQAEYARATQDVRRLELNLRVRLTAAMRNYEFARVTVDRYQNQILPKVDESLRLSEEAHEAGEFDFLRVLVARRTYFDANLNYVQALANLAKSNAVIEGLQLSGGLTDTGDYGGDDGLRGQALGGQ